ncbi:MAG TPA: PIN domain-containing protein [Burkholderiales bacterium]|nr:PIN domain-containing protein [Burkholderiales bacterium]
MTARVFVDTCVFLYAHDESEPDKRPRARTWLEHLWREMAGRTSIHVLSEYYLTVSRKLDPGLAADEAWNDAATYFAWRPQPMDEPLISRARLIEQRHHLGWWDSMVVGAAQLQDCAIVLTESLPDGMAYGEVTARSPFTLDAREPAAVYAAAPSVASNRHRPRGRPKRETAKV